MTVAPVTTRARRLPVEVPLGKEEGLPRFCVANLDTITALPKRALVERVSLLSAEKLAAVEDVLEFALGLDE